MNHIENLYKRYCQQKILKRHCSQNKFNGKVLIHTNILLKNISRHNKIIVPRGTNRNENVKGLIGQSNKYK